MSRDYYAGDDDEQHDGSDMMTDDPFEQANELIDPFVPPYQAKKSKQKKRKRNQ